MWKLSNEMASAITVLIVPNQHDGLDVGVQWKVLDANQQLVQFETEDEKYQFIKKFLQNLKNQEKGLNIEMVSPDEMVLSSQDTIPSH